MNSFMELTCTSQMYNAINDDNGLDMYKIDYLLRMGISINDKIDRFNNTALHLASHRGKDGIVYFLLNRSADVNAKNCAGDTPLHIAIKTNNIPIAKLLLDYNSDCNEINKYGITCFMLSLTLTNVEMLQFLIAYGVDITKGSNLEENKDITIGPLEYAVRLLKYDAVQLLINNGADIYQCIPETMDTPLHTISLRLKYDSESSKEDGLKCLKIAELLVKSGVNVNAQNIIKATPLHLAIESKDFPLVEFLVRNGSDLNISFEELKRTPLHLVVMKTMKAKYVDLFINYGSDYKQHDICGLTPYHWALFGLTNKNQQIIHVFWQHGCPYDLPLFPYTGKSPSIIRPGINNHIINVVECQRLMFEGIKTNNVKILEKALELGAVVRGTSMEIKYPLHFVSSKGYTEIGKLLLGKGIKVNNFNDENFTAIQLAIKYRQLGMCKLLFQHGAYLNYKEEIRKLDISDDESVKEIKDLLMSIFSWFSLIKIGNPIIIDLIKNLFENNEEMFIVHLNSLDKMKRSIMACAMHYGHGQIVEEIMKTRLNYKRKLLG